MTITLKYIKNLLLRRVNAVTATCWCSQICNETLNNNILRDVQMYTWIWRIIGVKVETNTVGVRGTEVAVGGWDVAVTAVRWRYLITSPTELCHWKPSDFIRRTKPRGDQRKREDQDERDPWHTTTFGASTGGRRSASYEGGRVMRSCDCSWSRNTAGSFRSVWTWERSSLRTTRSLTTSGELLSPHDSSLCQYVRTHTHTFAQQHKTAGNTLPRSEWIWKWYCTCGWVYECGSVSPGV